jgi:hypothetical protein
MNSTAVGVKGSDVYSPDGINSDLLVAYMKAVRGASYADISAWQDKVLEVDTNKAYADIAVLAFQTRDIRGGKGEREIFYMMIKNLASYDYDLVNRLMTLVPEYGSWMDIIHLKADPWANDYFQLETNNMILKQLKDDELALRNGRIVEISLLGKWLPREGNKYDAVAKSIATFVWDKDPNGRVAPTPMASYRKRTSALNRALKTVEVFECANRWDEIDPKMVPGRAREIKLRAYLNETKSGMLRNTDDKRLACRDNFKMFLKRVADGELKINGANTIYPHELVKGMLMSMSDDETTARNAVWASMIAEVKKLGGLGSSVAMCDFSGSMQTNASLPYYVSMAMGLMIASLNTGPFKNRFMTFDSNPTWHTIPEGASLSESINTINQYICQGLSTDFQKAMDLILETLKTERVPPGSEPKNLIVITDMGFDRACGTNEDSSFTNNSYKNVVKMAPWQTHYQMICESFKRAGENMWGANGGWVTPKIVIWNVASSYTNDFHATAGEEGVMMLSGWSPSLFKVLCEKGPQSMTSNEMLRAQLDNVRYDPVRKVVSEWAEGGWRLC